jgi:hypothetical protein
MSPSEIPYKETHPDTDSGDPHPEVEQVLYS